MRVLTALILFLFVQSAAAELVKYKDLMEEMGLHFKNFAVSMQSGELQEEDVKTIESLQRLMSRAAMEYPFSVDTDAHKILYSELNIKSIHKALLLESAVKEVLSSEEQDLEKVRELFSEINELRKHGHEEFKLD